MAALKQTKKLYDVVGTEGRTKGLAANMFGLTYAEAKKLKTSIWQVGKPKIIVRTRKG